MHHPWLASGSAKSLCLSPFEPKVSFLGERVHWAVR